MIRAVIFDLDQTLLDRTATTSAFLKKQHIRFRKSLKSDLNKYIETILLHQKNGYADKLLAYKQSCSDLGESDSLHKILYEDYKEKYGFKPILFPGVIDLLDEFQSHFKLGLVTNGRTIGQTAKLKSSGIDKYFDSIQISETLGIKKPNSKIFTICLDHLNVLPSEAVFIGDSLTNDIIPSKSIGMYTIWVTHNQECQSVECDVQINNILELRNVIRHINTQNS